MLNKEQLSTEIIHYNREVDSSISALQGIIKKIDSYREKFEGQRNLTSRVDMTKRIMIAAINHIENLRPRNFMIEDPEDILRPQIKVLAKKNYKAGANKR